jgi:hypothetical protein
MSNNNNRLPTRQSIDEATTEAEARPLDFSPSARARFVRDMLKEVGNYVSQGLTEEQIREKVPEFCERYPELFKKIIDKEDLTPIQSMLAMLDRMSEGTISQHQASMIVGQKLVDRFVKPQLDGGSSGKK